MSHHSHRNADIFRQTELSSGPASLEMAANKLGIRVRFAFACLTCLGGLVLASGIENEAIPVIAVFFSVFGFLFVDWLKIFAIPTVAAYAAMAVAALYCISDFVDLDAPGNQQMNAVAQLLVSVQAVMMMQNKTRKILEQLGVFCLLELVVSAIFNDAIHYAVLMLPICVVGGWGLTLLAAITASDRMAACSIFDEAESGLPGNRGGTTDGADPKVIQSQAVSSSRSLLTSGIRLPKVTLATLGPSIVLVGVIFFYAIPRTTSAHRNISRENAMVGFSDEVLLEQIGRMGQSSAVAARIKLRDKNASDGPYQLIDDLYVRGAVLEKYTAIDTQGQTTASWKSALADTIDSFSVLPPEYYPAKDSDAIFFDQVEVEVICEASRSNSLFGIAPYFRDSRTSNVLHEADRWYLSRPEKDQWVYPRKRYFFGTHAFRDQSQVGIIASTDRWEDPNAKLNDETSSILGFDGIEAQRRLERYRSLLLEFDPDSMGTIESIAERIVEDAGGSSIQQYDLAKVMEQYFGRNSQYGYTLNLDFDSVPGMDPIEQFVAVHRKGHCQYFASALAMMLRSQRIPARLIVGFRTDEFNELSQNYIVRQSHAHAWVEALINTEEMTNAPKVYGQPPADAYWVRLDPTPAGFLSRAEVTNVGQLIDSAQSAWDDYVVDMDQEKQDVALFGNAGGSSVQSSYSRLVERLSNMVDRIRAGQLGEGALAGGSLFSWQLALVFIVVAAILAILYKSYRPRWRSHLEDESELQGVPRPSIAFYNAALLELERLGIERTREQTPNELQSVVLQQTVTTDTDFTQPLKYLTRAFYQSRFGAELASPVVDPGGAQAPNASIQDALKKLQANVDQIVSSDSEPNNVDAGASKK